MLHAKSAFSSAWKVIVLDDIFTYLLQVKCTIAALKSEHISQKSTYFCQQKSASVFEEDTKPPGKLQRNILSGIVTLIFVCAVLISVILQCRLQCCFLHNCYFDY